MATILKIEMPLTTNIGCQLILSVYLVKYCSFSCFLDF